MEKPPDWVTGDLSVPFRCLAWSRLPDCPVLSLGCAILCCHLFHFPVAAITNDHKPGVIKPQEFVLCPFWRPEGQ